MQPSYEKFEDFLKQKNVSVSTICIETGIPGSTFSDWKKKKSYPKVAKLYKIANYFGVQIEDLLSNTGD